MSQQEPYFTYEDLHETAKERVLKNNRILTYLSKLKNIPVEEVTKTQILSHIELNKFKFDREGRKRIRGAF